jgi:hypothetical protein
MSQDSLQWAGALERIATGVDPLDGFSLERVRRAGTPYYWEERIALVAGSDARFETVRSAVDDGGEAIGTWAAKATPEQLRAAARAMVEARVWERSSESILPGQDELHYSYSAAPGLGSLQIAADSPLLFDLATLEGELREVANALRVEAGARERAPLYGHHRGRERGRPAGRTGQSAVRTQHP